MIKFEKDFDKIKGKIILKGELRLLTPLIIGAGNGEGKTQSGQESNVDSLVLKDNDDCPFIPATSLAGVLKNALTDFRDGKIANADELAAIFGTEDSRKENPAKELELQSSLTLYDITLNNTKTIVRDGVAIDPVTGTAIEGHKFDFEAVERGASGTFEAVFTRRGFHDRLDPKPLLEKLKKLLLSGFRVGARTTSGFGLVRIDKLTIDEYDFAVPEDTRAYLAVPERLPAKKSKSLTAGKSIVCGENDFAVELEFALNHSLIVRSYDLANIKKQSGSNTHVDAVSLRSGDDFLIPGSSVKGVLRHQAGYILRQLAYSPEKAAALINTIFGFTDEKDKQKKAKGHLLADEIIFAPSLVEEVNQSRNRIDRFTGGTIDSALFSEQALWQKDTDKALGTLRFVLQKPTDEQIGLLLFVLKDIWCGKVAFGGEKSIGRGFVHGLKATVSDRGRLYTIEKDKPAAPETTEALEKYAKALHKQEVA